MPTLLANPDKGEPLEPFSIGGWVTRAAYLLDWSEPRAARWQNTPKQRTEVHVLNFNHLYEEIKSGQIDEGWLSEVERPHNLFPDIDYGAYA